MPKTTQSPFTLPPRLVTGLKLEAYSLECLFDRDKLSEIERFIRSLVPEYLPRTMEEFWDDNLDLKQPGVFYSKLMAMRRESEAKWRAEEKRKRRPHNEAEMQEYCCEQAIRLNDSDVTLSTNLDRFSIGNFDRSLVYFGNYLSVCFGVKNARGSKLGDVAERTGKLLCSSGLFEHAICTSLHESQLMFNIGEPGSPVNRPDYSRRLYGFFWGNYFGPWLCDQIGHHKLEAVPGCVSVPLGPGRFVHLALPPQDCETPAYRQTVRDAIDHLGTEFIGEWMKRPGGKLFDFPTRQKSPARWAMPFPSDHDEAGPELRVVAPPQDDRVRAKKSLLVNFTAQTRNSMLDPDRIGQLQEVLKRLTPEFLPAELPIEYGASGAGVDLAEKGSLASMLLQGRRRQEERWRELEKFWHVAHDEEFMQDSIYAGHLDLKLPGRENGLTLWARNSPFRLGTHHRYIELGSSLSLSLTLKCDKHRSLADLTVQVANALWSNDLFDYAFCSARDEASDRYVRSTETTRFAQLDISRNLQAFQWGNYFGPWLSQHIGRKRLAKVPGCVSQRVGAGFFVYNQSPPEHWQLEEYRHNARAAIDHLGPEIFFDPRCTEPGKLFPMPKDLKQEYDDAWWIYHEKRRLRSVLTNPED